MAKPSRKRLTFEFSTGTLTRIEELSELLDTATTVETIRRAISFTLLMAREVRAGGIICIKQKDGEIKPVIILY